MASDAGRGTTDRFLQFNAVLTPTIGAGVAMTIANGLYVGFALPKQWTALILSTLIASMVFRNRGAVWEKTVLWIVNSLLVFALTVGGNTIGGAATGKSRHVAEADEEDLVPFPVPSSECLGLLQQLVDATEKRRVLVSEVVELEKQRAPSRALQQKQAALGQANDAMDQAEAALKSCEKEASAKARGSGHHLDAKAAHTPPRRFFDPFFAE